LVIESGQVRLLIAQLAGHELDRAYRLAGLILGNAAEAEDAVADAIEQGWSRAAQLHDPASFHAWFDRILVNVCRDRLRRRGRIRFVALADDVVDRRDPFRDVLARDEALRTLSELSDEERVVVVLHFWADLTLAEVAARLGWPVGTVKSRLHRALERMRTADLLEMSDDPRLRQAFRALPLPTAPGPLVARLDEISRRPVPAPRWRRGRWSVMVSVGATLLIAFAVTLSGAGRLRPVGGLTHFNEQGLAFDYPASWRTFHYQEVSSFTNLVAYLATVDVPEPCITTEDSISSRTDCSDRYVLTPDSLVVAVSSNGLPGFSMLNVPAGATPIVVDGLPAYFVHETSTAVSADETLTWTLARPGSVDNDYTIRASIRGPHLEQFETALRALVASVRFEPAVVPLPSGPGAPDAAATRALGILAKDSRTWSCFPAPGGTRQMEVTSLTNGPTLAHSQVATCTTTIEATPLQLWRMMLTLRLPEADAQAGHGELITVWVNRDGTPGETQGSSLP